MLQRLSLEERREYLEEMAAAISSGEYSPTGGVGAGGGGRGGGGGGRGGGGGGGGEGGEGGGEGPIGPTFVGVRSIHDLPRFSLTGPLSYYC